MGRQVRSARWRAVRRIRRGAGGPPSLAGSRWTYRAPPSSCPSRQKATGGGASASPRMVIVLWWLLECKALAGRSEPPAEDVAAEDGRICPHCGGRALVGHGRRKRTVHWGAEPGKRWPVCKVLEFEVQRVRYRASAGWGRRHTRSLPAPSGARGQVPADPAAAAGGRAEPLCDISGRASPFHPTGRQVG